MNSKSEIEKITKCFKFAYKEPVLKDLFFTNKHTECYVFKILFSFAVLCVFCLCTMVMCKELEPLEFFVLLACLMPVCFFLYRKIEKMYIQKYCADYVKIAYEQKENKFYLFKYLLPNYIDADLERLDVVLRRGKRIYDDEKHFSFFFIFGGNVFLSAVIACIFNYCFKSIVDFKSELQNWLSLLFFVGFDCFLLDSIYIIYTHKFDLKARALRALEQYIIEEKEKSFS